MDWSLPFTPWKQEYNMPLHEPEVDNQLRKNINLLNLKTRIKQQYTILVLQWACNIVGCLSQLRTALITPGMKKAKMARTKTLSLRLHKITYMFSGWHHAAYIQVLYKGGNITNLSFKMYFLFQLHMSVHWDVDLLICYTV